jgi:hypothetical protein
MRRKVPIKDIYLAGQLAGAAAQIDIEELEKYLDSNPPNFHYAHWCRAAIAFAKAVTTTISN